MSKTILSLSEIRKLIDKLGWWKFKSLYPKEALLWNKAEEKRRKKKLKELYGRVPTGDRGFVIEKNRNDRRKRFGLK
ncbi:MAG: hypothetical protein SFU25_12035 [Candidatus Caenarcaniphilales bacterium]|nr:hypothetical protein [Candidatus Caenarcaniphilales bacterium]